MGYIKWDLAFVTQSHVHLFPILSHLEEVHLVTLVSKPAHWLVISSGTSRSQFTSPCISRILCFTKWGLKFEAELSYSLASTAAICPVFARGFPSRESSTLRISRPQHTTGLKVNEDSEKPPLPCRSTREGALPAHTQHTAHVL